MQILYIDSLVALDSVVKTMEAESTYLAVDTEFRREDTYFPELCLIQVATADKVFLIDALAIQDLSVFFRVLTNPKVLKVFHAGRQDLEIFCYLMQGAVTSPVFDTQVAAMLVGYGESAGFETLVSKILGASLDKSYRHTDWTKRPLTEEQKAYAINDVLYLRPLYDEMLRKLKQKGRLEWMKEEVRLLETPDFLITKPSEAWRRLSLKNSAPRYRLLVQKLMTWREKTAQRTNVPRSWLIKDEVILNIASRKPITLEGLKKLPYFPREDLLIGEEILAIIHEVFSLPEEALPPVEMLPSLSKSQQSILEMLKLLLKVTADRLELNPKLIAEKEELVKWIAKGVTEREEKANLGWRHELFWQPAQLLLEGKLSLCLQKGRVIIVEN